jgi:hypothetical protein
MPMPSSNSDTRAVREMSVVAALCACVFAVVVRRFFDVEDGVGTDYGYFFPRLLDLAWWRRASGVLSVPWFSPSFCGGIPIAADAQDLSFALPGLLVSWVDPLEASYLTAVAFALLGAVGFARLLHRGFGASVPTALLGGVVVGFNGAFEARVLAGHLAYHGMMLVPWVCLGVVGASSGEGSARWRRVAGDTLLTGFGLAYIAWCGLLNLAVPLGLAVVAVALVHGLLRGGGYRDKALRLALGGALAMGLGGARAAAFASYFSHFHRDGYPLPGIAGVGRTLSTALLAVFGWIPPVRTPVSNSRWVLEPHEWDYVVGPLPALALLAAAVAWARARRGAPAATPTTRADRAALGLLLAVLAVPIAINVYTPGWNALLKRLPIISSSSNLLRWWLAYVFVAPLALLVLDRLAPQHRRGASMLGVALVLGLFVARPRPHGLVRQYAPDPVLAAWHQTHARGDTIPVTDISSFKDQTIQRNSALVGGASQLFCYEPTFGYWLEAFPRRSLHVGPVTDVRNGVLNLKDPSCYLWPDENHCRPGDHFPVARRDAALAFAARRPFAFAVSRRQRLAEAVTALTWLGALATAVALVVGRLRRRSVGSG